MEGTQPSTAGGDGAPTAIDRREKRCQGPLQLTAGRRCALPASTKSFTAIQVMRPVEAVLPQAQARLAQVLCLELGDGEHVAQEVFAAFQVYVFHLAACVVRL